MNQQQRRNPTLEFVEKGLRPGSEFQVDPVDLSLVHTPVKRVAIFTEAFLPKIDGVSKTALFCQAMARKTQLPNRIKLAANCIQRVE